MESPQAITRLVFQSPMAMRMRACAKETSIVTFAAKLIESRPNSNRSSKIQMKIMRTVILRNKPSLSSKFQLDKLRPI